MFRQICFVSVLWSSISVFAATQDQPVVLNFPQKAVEVEISFIQGPEVRQEAQLQLQVLDPKTRQPLEISDEVQVKPFMPSMGHGSRPTEVSRVFDAQGQVRPGLYQVKKVFFSMPCDWEVRVQLKSADGVAEVKSFPLFFQPPANGSCHH